MYSTQNEPVSLERDCDAVLIPAGEKVTLPEGTSGFITQALGGSFTIYIEGNLFRIAGYDADAIGRDPIKPPPVPDDASDQDIEAVVWEQLKTCFDPEIPINIVDLGLIYDLVVEPQQDGNNNVEVKMTLTAQGCGMGPVIAEDARSKIAALPQVSSAKVHIVWDPVWTPQMISPEGRQILGLE
jgi:probable FeS assembly SUF system protein SufT